MKMLMLGQIFKSSLLSAFHLNQTIYIWLANSFRSFGSSENSMSHWWRHLALLSISRSIHEQSLRKDKPFYAIDCGAIPKEVAASELCILSPKSLRLGM